MRDCGGFYPQEVEAPESGGHCGGATRSRPVPDHRLSTLVTDAVADTVRLDHSRGTQSAPGLYTAVSGESENECPISSDM